MYKHLSLYFGSIHLQTWRRLTLIVSKNLAPHLNFDRSYESFNLSLFCDNNNNNIDDGRILDNDDIYNVDSTNNDNNDDDDDDDENYYKGATLFGLEPKSYPSSSSTTTKNDVLDNTFGMQYTSMVIFVLSCYVTVMLFLGEDVGVTNVV